MEGSDLKSLLEIKSEQLNNLINQKRNAEEFIRQVDAEIHRLEGEIRLLNELINAPVKTVEEPSKE